MRTCIAPLTLVLCLAGAAASAQERPDPASSARFRLGPVAFAPVIELRNIGIDSNVFNEPSADEPQSDFTATFAPGVKSWMRVGRARLSVEQRVDLVYFHKFDSQRSANSNGVYRLELPLARVTPYVSHGLLFTRDRPGFEIDARARRTERTLTAGADVQVGSRLTTSLAVRRGRHEYSANETFQGTYLRELLNRDVDSVELAVRHKATPLTTLVLLGESRRERFDESPARDADSVRITPGVEFDAFAIISGKGFVGFRRMDFRSPDVPDFAGLVASGDLGYRLLGSTRFNLKALRDIAYSYQVDEPYYVQTGATLSVTQVVKAGWDVVGRVGRQRLAYERRAGAVVVGNRVDGVWIVGGGAGYRFSQGLRLGINVDSYRRRSDSARRDYDGLLVGSTVTYEF
jgi:hypothetical protein